MATADLAEAAEPLYALAPADFTAARTARTKQARGDGDRDLAGRIGALRKPTVAAWAVNLLVRRHPDDVEELLALGGRLLEAQAARQGDTLRELARRQHELMGVARGQVADLAAEAGVRVSETVHAQVEGTLRAAMTDPEAAAAVRSGLLVTELVSTGFEPVEVADAVAVPGGPPLTGARSDDGAGDAAGDGTGDPTDGATPSDEGGDAEVRLPGRRTPATRPGGERRASERGASERGATRARTDLRERPAPARVEGGHAPRAPEKRADAERAAAERDAAERAAAEQDAAARAAAEREDVARRRRREEAEEDVAGADAQADAAAAELRSAEEALAHLTQRHAELAREIEQLTERIAAAQDEQTATSVEQRRARKARDAAARTADTAARRAQAARARLERLT